MKVSRYSFKSSYRDVQDLHTFAPFRLLNLATPCSFFCKFVLSLVLSIFKIVFFNFHEHLWVQFDVGKHFEFGALQTSESFETTPHKHISSFE